MAIVKGKSLPTSGAAWVTWFTGLGCSLITGSGSTVIIDGTYTITKDTNSITCSKSGSQVFQMLCNNPCIVTVCCSNTLVYIQCSDPQNRRFLFVYEKLEDITLFGYYNSGNTTGITFKSITDIALTDVSTGIEYTHGARLNFTSQLGQIGFTGDALFQAGVRDISDSNFISCTAVTTNQVYAFGLNNFYSVGPNTLVRMDLN